MEKEIIQLLIETLKFENSSIKLTSDSKLLGAVAELDSLMVVNLLTRIEENYKIKIEDDEIDGSIFKTVGTLTAFVQEKLNAI